jgi:hypothetical protein
MKRSGRGAGLTALNEVYFIGHFFYYVPQLFIEFFGLKRVIKVGEVNPERAEAGGGMRRWFSFSINAKTTRCKCGSMRWHKDDA